MVASSELRDMGFASAGYFLIVDGWPYSFVSDTLYNLEGTSWAESTGSISYAPVTASLRNDFIIHNKLDLREGQLADNTVTFTLWDKDGRLAPLIYRSIDEDAEGAQGIIDPDENANVLFSDEGNNITGKNIGHEKLGSSGERHLYPAFQTTGSQFRLGAEHFGSFPGLEIPSAVISDYPLVHLGRRVVLYEIMRDHVANPANVLGGTGGGSWRPVSEARPVWFGVISGLGSNAGTADEIQITCYGASALLKGTLSPEVSEKEFAIRPLDAELTDEEKLIGYSLQHIVFDPREKVGSIEKDTAAGDEVINPQIVTFHADWTHTQEINVGNSPTKGQIATAIKAVIDPLISAQAFDTTADIVLFNNHWSDANGVQYAISWDDVESDGAFGGDGVNEFNIDSDCLVTIKTRNIDSGWDSTNFGDLDGLLSDQRLIVMPQIKLSMHYKMWALMGYDVFGQNAMLYTDNENKEEYGLSIARSSDLQLEPASIAAGVHVSVSASNGNAPDGYYTVYFHTCAPDLEHGGGYEKFIQGSIQTPKIGVDQAIDQKQPERIANDGNTRVFKPFYPSGFGYLVPNINFLTRQEIELDGGQAYSRGQKHRPPLGQFGDNTQPYTMTYGDTGDVNRRGLWLFYGKNAYFAFDNPIDEFQVYDASWRAADDNTFDVEDNHLVLHQSVAPASFGLPNVPLFVPWAAPGPDANDEDRIHATPISWIIDRNAINLSDTSPLDRMIQSILCTTGHGVSWTNYQGIILGGVTFNAGSNDNGAESATDNDWPSYGLGIPKDFVADPNEWKELIDGLPGNLKYGRLYWRGGLELDKVWKGICQSRGLAWSLHGKKLSMFDYTKGIDPADDDVMVITQQMMADPNRLHVPMQTFRSAAPIDKINLKYNYDIVKQNFASEYTYKSKDKSAKYRFGNRVVNIEDRTLNKDMAIISEFKTQMRKVTAFWEKTHNIVTINLHRNYGMQLDVGSKVAITDTRIRSSTGTRGVSLVTGRVIAWKLDAARQIITIDVLLYAEHAIAKRYVPFARATGYDSGNNRLYVDSDFLEVGNNRKDAGYFTEPTYLSGAFGGQAEIQVWQRIGRSDSWESVGTANVASVDADAGYLNLVSGSLDNYLRDRDTFVFMANHGAQDALWVRSIYGVTTNASGTYSGNVMPKWMDS